MYTQGWGHKSQRGESFLREGLLHVSSAAERLREMRADEHMRDIHMLDRGKSGEKGFGEVYQ
jgi:hypothetical protein